MFGLFKLAGVSAAIAAMLVFATAPSKTATSEPALRPSLLIAFENFDPVADRVPDPSRPETQGEIDLKR